MSTNPVPSLKRSNLNVIFFTPTNMKTGAGVENVFAEYILNKPEWVNVKVIQGDFLPGERMDEGIMKKLRTIAEFETWHIPVERFDDITKHLGILRNFIFTLLIKLIYLPHHKREIVDAIKGYDCIYLFGNWWAVLFPRGIVMVGAQHTDFGFTKGSIISSLKVFLIRTNFLYRKITGFHLFPQSVQLKNLIKKGNNFLLPPRGVDFESFNIGERKGRAKFLYVSRLEECKGILFIISVWKELNPNAELYVIGSGSLEQRVKQETEKEENVKFIGNATRSELIETYSKCDIFLAPTACDNFPIVVAEALSSGLNVMASEKLRGIFDVFFQRGYISYLPVRKEEWKREILRKIENIPEIRRLNSDIRKLAKEKFDSKEISREFFNQIEKMTDRAKKNWRIR